MGNSDLPPREQVGSKALNLMRISRIGIRVPPGFVIGAQNCAEYLQAEDHGLGRALTDAIKENLVELQRLTGETFGSQRKPLLVSIRSGAAVSMPGMMETILNVGLNDSTVTGLVRSTGNPRFARDSYRRLIQSFAEVVHQCPPEPFEESLAGVLRANGLDGVNDLDSQELAQLCRQYLEIFEEHTGCPFPQDPTRQLTEGIEAVFRSWNSPRAKEYRRIRGIEAAGTAATIQAMVFGNMGPYSGSGVAFTRDPVNGETGTLYMDFVLNGQGEDIVSGRQAEGSSGVAKLAQMLPGVYSDSQSIGGRLELEFGDMQDFEFTVQERVLYVLQTRTGKRTPWAALKIAVDLANAGVIDRRTALSRLGEYNLSEIKRSKLNGANLRPLAAGVAASGGVASGEIAFDSESVQGIAKAGRPSILVREDTSTSDISGMNLAAGILTRLGGKTSHAAVVARQMDKVCIVGCSALGIRMDDRSCSIAGRTFSERQVLSLDGNSGNVYDGALEVVEERPVALLAEIEGWKRSG